MNAGEAHRLAHAAMQAWSRGDAAGGEKLAQQALALNPRDPNALQVAGVAALRGQRWGEAAGLLRAADAVAPNQPPIVNMLGAALRRLGDLDSAREAFRRAGALGLAEAWRNLGELENGETNFEAALTAFEKAVALAPNAPAANAALALALERKHDLKRAKVHAERALRADAGSQTARLALAQIALRERDYAAVHAVSAALLAPGGASPTNQAIAWGLVGEAHDRAGAADAAFAAFTAANQLLLRLHGDVRDATDSPFHPLAVERMARVAPQADVSRWPARTTGEAPVFLVGFPRSGTTLLDQILASHSGIVCLEEKEILAPILADHITTDTGAAAIGEMPQTLIDERRARYWAQAEAALRAPRAGRILVDKLPLNIIFLPAIARVFPNAKIIVALRDPRDVMLSCYQQRFGMNPAMAQLLELETGARYYDAVMGLYLTCRERLPLALHEIRYEDLVADVEAAARGLAAFLGVAFEPAMLDFTATAKRRDIGTPSARQVIEPIYNRSVGRWRAYAAHLAPVLATLTAWARRFGYAA